MDIRQAAIFKLLERVGLVGLVDDPIENVIGTTWNQGGGWKSGNIPGYIENNKVVLELDKVKVSHAVG